MQIDGWGYNQKMSIVFMDADFNNISNPIDNYTSLTWTENWNEPGTFSLTLPANNFPTARNAKYLYTKKRNAYAIITNIDYSTTNPPTLKIDGKSIEAILGLRVIDDDGVWADLNMLIWDEVPASEIIPYVLDELTQRGDRQIPNLIIEYDDFLAIEGEYTGISSTRALDTWLYAALKPLDLSYRIEVNESGNMILKVVAGVDRTQAQTANTPAIFSTNFGTFTNVTYQKSIKDYYNFAYASYSTGGQQGVISIDLTDGGERREVLISPSVPTNIDQIEIFERVWWTQALALMEEYRIVETITGEVNTKGALKYGEHYSIGDLCDVVVPELQAEPISARITSVDFVYEPTGDRIIPRFGDGELSFRNFIKREMGKTI